MRTVTTDSGTEPGSRTQLAPRVTRIADKMITKFIHHKRLMINEFKLRIPHRFPQKFAFEITGQFDGGAAKTGVRLSETE
jgi:hypothetical protein